MSQPVMFTQDDKPSSLELTPATAFEKLQELTRQGYAPDPEPQGGGILLRHPSGPDLILRPDGGIDLPRGEAGKPRRATLSRIKKRIWWGRSFLFLFILATGILLGWLMTAAVFAD